MGFFPSVETYSEDAAHLGEMLGFFRQECVDYLNGKFDSELMESYNNSVGWERKLQDGRYCLTQFPHGHSVTAKSLMAPTECLGHDLDGTKLASKRLSFVGFLGRSNPELTAELICRADRLVKDLMVLMCNEPDVLLYGTAHCSVDDNNCYNLVVIRNEEAGTRWKEGELHMREAVIGVSPEYYTSIRIHTGDLPDGLDSTQFNLKRSVLLDYTAHQKDPNAPIHREVKLWTQ